MRALFALLGAGIGAAVLVLVSGVRARARPDRPARAERRRARAGMSALRIAAVLTVGAVIGAATRWPIAAVLAGIAAWALPSVLGPDRAQKRTLARVEAIAAWAEDLSGTLRAAAGIEQTILETAAVAPVEIRSELSRLAEALRAGIRLPDALRAFAKDLSDPTADMVANVLLQAAQYQARDIAVGLSGVGRRARRQASSRLRIATGRARTRTATRIVICVMLSTVVLMAMFGGDFLAPYGTGLGQLILAALGALFGAALVWMVRTGRVRDLPRILTGSADDVAVLP
ncbi:type II secretion system F family protein [Actinoplanes aureus]|uniref:Type II secretion system F family protein n=1 Tax=Actinoplanes aureus TaxID=2792083 RepID=A0A931CQ25_9ACTN|nr:type II secretion system F family protein [Actinoplanes aureus]MBG0569005.1 type II secretion system F family protein [Actinoplanes aureus]